MFNVQAETILAQANHKKTASSLFNVSTTKFMIGTPHIKYMFLLCGFEADALSTLP